MSVLKFNVIYVSHTSLKAIKNLSPPYMRPEYKSLKNVQSFFLTQCNLGKINEPVIRLKVN